MAALHTGAFVLSLDLDSPVQGGASQAGAFGPVGSKLIGILAARGIEATWAVSGAKSSSWLEPLRAVEPAQEIALLADANWVSGSRAEFAAGLVALTTEARSASIWSSTLAWKTAASPEHLDLLVKQGITAVRPLASKPGSSISGGWKGWLQGDVASAGEPQALRWGLWQIAGTTDLLAGGIKEIRRAIDGAVELHSVVHLAIDVASIATRELDVLDQALAHVEDRRAKGQIGNWTLAGLAQQLIRPRQAAPAGSILRRSAA